MNYKFLSNNIVRMVLSFLILMIFTNLPTLKPLQTAYAVSFTVTKTADTNDGICDTDCSLREAIIAANANPGGDTINLAAGTYNLSISGTDEDNAATGDLDINDDLNIVGTGSGNTIIDGGRIDRVIHITGAYIVNISHLDLVDGYYFSPIGSNGGGVLNTTGDLTLSFTTIKGNTCFYGGGIANLSGMTNIFNSTISGNTAVNGGGILNDTGTLTMVNSTVSGNTAEGSGIGIKNTSGTVNLNNVTITKNMSVPPLSNGGGIAGDSVYISNSIIAGNVGGNHPDCSGTLISQGYNLIMDTTGCTISGDTTGNLTGVDPLLGLLQDNGGETHTHSLLSGSPAIDTGNPALPGSGDNACASEDQRSVLRPQGSGCDMGSYEFFYSTSPTLAGLPDVIVDHTTNLPVTIDLWAFASDAETPDSELTFTIEGSPPPGAGVTIVDNRWLIIDPSFDWCGYVDITIRVTDPGGLWDEDILRVAVTWVCKGPLPVPNQLAPQDVPITLDLSAYEPQIGDGTGMFWSVTGEEHCAVTGEGSTDDVLTFTPQPGFLGTDTITLHMTYPWGEEVTQKLTLTWRDAEMQGFRLYLPMTTRNH